MDPWRRSYAQALNPILAFARIKLDEWEDDEEGDWWDDEPDEEDLDELRREWEDSWQRDDPGDLDPGDEFYFDEGEYG